MDHCSLAIYKEFEEYLSQDLPNVIHDSDVHTYKKKPLLYWLGQRSGMIQLFSVKLLSVKARMLGRNAINYHDVREVQE